MALLKRPAGATKQKKRLGRGPGSGNGTTAGKGTKGQNARSGGGVRPGFEGGQMPLYRRVARRGFSNYWFKKDYTPINLSTLEKRFAKGETVDLESLRARGLVSANEKLVKILGNGEITKALVISGLKVSGPARVKIEAAGGSIEGMPPVEESGVAPAKTPEETPSETEASDQAAAEGAEAEQTKDDE